MQQINDWMHFKQQPRMHGASNNWSGTLLQILIFSVDKLLNLEFYVHLYFFEYMNLGNTRDFVVMFYKIQLEDLLLELVTKIMSIFFLNHESIYRVCFQDLCYFYLHHFLD
jgi:hypothetical protein